jgi:60 kDa SS-A/Ro ribonucleoprotein
VAALTVEVRTKMKLSHAPLLLVREMARHSTHRKLVANSLAAVIQRADELAEFVAIYWKDGRVPLSAQVKKGLAAVLPKFDEYALGSVACAMDVRSSTYNTARTGAMRCSALSVDERAR